MRDCSHQENVGDDVLQKKCFLFKLCFSIHFYTQMNPDPTAYGSTPLVIISDKKSSFELTLFPKKLNSCLFWTRGNLQKELGILKDGDDKNCDNVKYLRFVYKSFPPKDPKVNWRRSSSVLLINVYMCMQNYHYSFMLRNRISIRKSCTMLIWKNTARISVTVFFLASNSEMQIRIY